MTLLWGPPFAAFGAAVGALAWWHGMPRTASTKRPVSGIWWVACGAGLACAAIAVMSASLWRAAFVCPFAAVIAVCAIIDARTRIIPNRLTYPSLVVYAVAIFVAGISGGSVDMLSSGIGFLAFGGGLMAVALAVPQGMGMGDVKLAALMGLVLGAIGLRAVEAAAGAAFVSGGVAAIVALAMGRGRKATMPFGPFLAFGGLVGSFVAVRLGT
jgi:leader peptidase (prepilin peptidase) / N-methyltransferase